MLDASKLGQHRVLNGKLRDYREMFPRSKKMRTGEQFAASRVRWPAMAPAHFTAASRNCPKPFRGAMAT
jgi:hypothetical protein